MGSLSQHSPCAVDELFQRVLPVLLTLVTVDRHRAPPLVPQRLVVVVVAVVVVEAVKVVMVKVVVKVVVVKVVLVQP